MKITQEMTEHFNTRTNLHINLVKKWYEKIYQYYKNTLYKDGTLKRIHINNHDFCKFELPEYTPYVYLTWKYYCKDNNIELNLSEEIENSIHKATLHHIQNNAHHPEYWDLEFDNNKLSKKDRDEIPEVMVNATEMSLSHLAEMLADWLAMSEEKETDVIEWADKNVNKRWKFTQGQVDFIYKTLNKVSKGPTLWSR